MDRKKLETQLLIDEGEKLIAYLDTRGILTAGIGHKVTPADHLKLGDAIDQDRCDFLFDLDVTCTIDGIETLIHNWDAQCEEVQQILANMAFNLGITGLSHFHHFLGYIQDKDYMHAAVEMICSEWYTEVGARAARLHTRMVNLTNP